MSYTLTIDEPEVAAYMTKRGPQIHDEFKTLLVAYVKTRLASEHVLSRQPATGLSFARAWSRLSVADGELDLSRRDESLRDVVFS